MPKDLTKENVNAGKIIYEWTVREYEQYERGRGWYIMMGVASLALLIYAVVTANYLFSLVIMLFGIILIMHELQEPQEVYFGITESGIILGKKYYRYSELGNFWIVYNPPEVKNLYFSINNVLKHRLQVPLLDYDPRAIRDYLNQYLTEDLDQEEEPLSDRLARLLKIH